MISREDIVRFIKFRKLVWLGNWERMPKERMVIENVILRQILGPKRLENGEWRRLHNDEPHSLYPSFTLVRTLKSRGLR